MNKGFSLVELIVVIAIMAILVGVAVPVYTSYIEKANDAADIQAIDNLDHACEIVGIEYNVAISYTSGTNSLVATVSGDKAAAAVTQLQAILGDAAVVNTTNNTITIALNDTPVAYDATPTEGENNLNKPMVPKGVNGGTPIA